MVVQAQSNIKEVGPHQHAWARSSGGGMGFEECVVCNTRRAVTPVLSGIGGFAVQAPSLPGANPKAEEKLSKGMKPMSERMGETDDDDQPLFVVAGPRTVTDTLTGLPPQSYHMAEPPDNEDDAPTVAQLTGFAITPTTNIEEGEVVDPRDEKASEAAQAEGESSDEPTDSKVRRMRHDELVAYARQRNIQYDESMSRPDLAEHVIRSRSGQ